MTVLDIFEPRYRDNTVLLARYKLPAGQDVKVSIKKGAYKGLYKVTNETICHSAIETINSRSGRPIQMRAVSLDAMERIEDGE